MDNTFLKCFLLLTALFLVSGQTILKDILKCDFKDPKNHQIVLKCPPIIEAKPQAKKWTKQEACESFEKTFECYANEGCLDVNSVPVAKAWLKENGFDCSPDQRNKDIVLNIFGDNCKLLKEPQAAGPELVKCMGGLQNLIPKDIDWLKDPNKLQSVLCKIVKVTMGCFKGEPDCFEIDAGLEKVIYALMTEEGYDCTTPVKPPISVTADTSFEALVTCGKSAAASKMKTCSAIAFLTQVKTKFTKGDMCNSFDKSLTCLEEQQCMDDSTRQSAKEWMKLKGLDCSKDLGEEGLTIGGPECKTVTDEDMMKIASCLPEAFRENPGEIMKDPSKLASSTCKEIKAVFDCMKGLNCFKINAGVEKVIFDSARDLGEDCGSSAITTSSFLIVSLLFLISLFFKH